MVKGIARACNKYGVAVATFNGDAIAVAIAKATASALAEGDLQGSGYVEATQTSVAMAVAHPVASVLVDAVAYAYGHSVTSSVFIEADSSVQNEFASAKSEGFSAIGGIGAADVRGNAAASTQHITRCHGSARRCCSYRNARQRTCPCPRYITLSLSHLTNPVSRAEIIMETVIHLKLLSASPARRRIGKTCSTKTSVIAKHDVARRTRTSYGSCKKRCIHTQTHLYPWSVVFTCEKRDGFFRSFVSSPPAM